MAADVRAGLTKPFKELSPRYFYDKRGSELFEQITELPEYYPTRCEREILREHSAEICAAASNPVSLIELGSGSAAKTRVFLDAMRDVACLRTYCPVDISEEITRDTALADRRGVPGGQRSGPRLRLRARPRAASGRGPPRDRLPRRHDRQLRALQRAGFLRRIANLLDSEDRFLLGTDLVKDRETLEAAYDDAQGSPPSSTRTSSPS